MALLAAVLAMGVLGFLGTTFASLVVQHQYAAVNQSVALHALYLAEAGFELAIQELLDNQDKAFNGAAADGVIGGITNVPVGSGTVSVTKGTETPPVFTATGTVGDVRRVIQMTMDVRQVVTQYWNFPNGTDLANGWKEFDKVQNNSPAEVSLSTDNGPSFSTDGTRSFKISVDGPNTTYFAHREQFNVNVNVPAKRWVSVRLDFKKFYNLAVGLPQTQELAVLLWRSSDSTSQVLWSDAVITNNNLWQTVDKRGILTGSPGFDRVRFRHDLAHGAGVVSGEETRAFIDNIRVFVVEKSAWGEP